MFDNRSMRSVATGSGAIGSAAPNRRQPEPAQAADPFALPPGPELASALEHANASALDVADRLDLLRAWARLESWVAAGKMRAIVDVAALGPADLVGGEGRRQVVDSGSEVVAAALRLSPRAAQSELGWARALTGSCQRTFDALAVGSISPRSARVVCEETLELDDELVSQVESRVLNRAQHQTPQQLRRSLRRAICVLAPGHEDARCYRERGRRCVRLTPASHGMAVLEAYLPAEQAHAAFAVLTAAARQARERDRGACADSAVNRADPELDSLDAYRADLLVSAVSNIAVRLEAAGVDPALWQAQVVVDLATVLGLADNPGELRGYGPLPAGLARQLAADATWTRWLTEPTTGALLDVGRKRYVPSERLRQFIQARDRVCRFPGCEQPAHRCDLDHAQPWDAGGETTTANLGALCRRHHRMKTHCDWGIIESAANGACTWRTPTGHKIDVAPEPVLPTMPALPAISGADPPRRPGGADPPIPTGGADPPTRAGDRFEDPGNDPPF